MYVRFGQRMSVGLFGLLLLCAGAMRPTIAQAAINVSLTTNHGCSGPAFNPGNTIRVFFSVDQTSQTSMTLQNPTGSPATPIFTNFTAQAFVTYEVDGTASSTAGPRRLTLTASNATMTGSMTCDYSVATTTTTAPTVMIQGLSVNQPSGAVTAMCGATVNSTDTVCVVFSTDQSGTATITSSTNMGPSQLVASGSVTPGTWFACMNPPLPSGTTVFTVTVSNTNGTSTPQTCNFTVGPSMPPNAPVVSILGLRVNGTGGVNMPCGAHVAGGSQVCVFFTTSQNGTATVSVTKGMTTTVVASGAVDTVHQWFACVTAGFDTGPRTFTVTVSNANGTSAPQTCGYQVP